MLLMVMAPTVMAWHLHFDGDEEQGYNNNNNNNNNCLTTTTWNPIPTISFFDGEASSLVQL